MATEPEPLDTTWADYLQTLDIDALQLDERGAIVPAMHSADPFSLDDLPPLDFADDAEGGEFRLGDTLGRGGVGLVRAATQIALDRQVAVKQVRPDRLSAAAQAALLREGWVTGHLEHPNIPPVYALGRSADGTPHLVMKRVEGTRWSNLLQALPSDASRFDAARLDVHLEILEAVCQALAYAHDHGVIHRDIKPDNVMIGQFGEVYLLDWGLAVALEPLGPLPVADKVRSIAGTPGYLAPEMARPDGSLGVCSDVYLLGATLHQVLTGQARHQGAGLEERLASAFESTQTIYAPEVPRDLAELCNRACARVPDDRPPSAEAFRTALLDHRTRWGATRLADTGAARLAALQGLVAENDTDPARVEALATEARFAFEQASRAWPGLGQAEAGHKQVLEVLCGYHLDRQNLGAAAALLGQLPDDRVGDLEARMQALQASLEARDRASVELAEIRHQQSLAVGSGERMAVTIGLVAGTLLAVVALIALAARGWRPSYPVILGTIGAYLLASLVGRIWASAGGETEATRRENDARIVLVLTAGMAMTAAWALGLPLTEGLVVFHLCLAVGMAIVGVFLGRWFMASAVSYGLGTLAVVGWPALALPILLAAHAAVGLFVAVRHRRIVADARSPMTSGPPMNQS